MAKTNLKELFDYISINKKLPDSSSGKPVGQSSKVNFCIEEKVAEGDGFGEGVGGREEVRKHHDKDEDITEGEEGQKMVGSESPLIGDSL